MPVIIHKKITDTGALTNGRTRQWLASKEKGSAASALLENYFEEDGFVPPHYHNTEELLICLSGSGQIIADGITYDFPEGTVAIIPPCLIHKVLNAGKEMMRMLAFFPVSEPDLIWMDDRVDP